MSTRVLHLDIYACFENKRTREILRAYACLLPCVQKKTRVEIFPVVMHPSHGIGAGSGRAAPV